LLNSRDLILSLHRFPENNFTPEESWKSFQETLSNICQDAEKQGISVYLRMCQAKPPWNLQDAIQFINRVGAKNLYLAPNIGLLLAQNVRPADIAGWIDRLGLWLASTPAFDIGGHLWSVHNPLIKGNWQSEIKKFLSLAPNIPVVFDVPYKNWDEVYGDLMRFRD